MNSTQIINHNRGGNSQNHGNVIGKSTQNKINIYQRIKAITTKFDQVYVNGEETDGDQLNIYKHFNIQTNLTIQKDQISKDTSLSPQVETNQSSSQELSLYYNNNKNYLQNLEFLHSSPSKQTIFLKKARLKQYRAKFITRRQDFIIALSQISDKLFNCKQGNSQEQINQKKKILFQEQLKELNKKIQEQDQIKSTCSMQSLSDDGQIQNQINFSHTRGYKFYFKDQYHEVKQILIQKSRFISTKNRNPLLLDFGFSRFIYKNDDQLAHQLIAYQLIRYLNKIFGKQYILEYQIIPEIKGALYQFVQNSMTIAQIKKEYKNGMIEYVKYLAQTKNINLNVIQKKFAQSYAGYCIAQFLLQIKDRNNANLMLRDDGTFFHIDLAFIFAAKPGGISFESAPFKMTKQYIQVLGGFNSDNFKYFQSLLIQLLTKLHQSKDQFLWKISILSARSKQIKCFNGFNFDDYYKKKFIKNLGKITTFVQDLIDKSYDNWNTKKYDSYQFKVNKIPA